jgi:HipA-like C-terminal domain
MPERLHQEDFCQALGIVSEFKYQKEGGPSLKQCFGLLRDVSSAPVIDLARLLDAVIYNYLVGNNDAHGKNFSLLYKPLEKGGRETSLSPLYYIVSTVYYPELSRDMAIRIGGEYSRRKSWRAISSSWRRRLVSAGLSSGAAFRNWRTPSSRPSRTWRSPTRPPKRLRRLYVSAARRRGDFVMANLEKELFTSQVRKPANMRATR